MADTKISDLTALTGADAATTDVFPVVDVDANTTKKMTRAEMFLNTPPITVAGTLSATTSAQGGPSGGGGLILQTYTGGTFGAIYSTSVTPGATNYSLISTGANTYLNGTASSNLTVGSTLIAAATSTALTLGTGVNLVMASATTVRLGGYTVATLPAAGTAGRTAYVTDATAPTYLGALTGGGAVVCPVFDNGVAWVSA